MKKVLMILTSHDELGDTGKKTGTWLEEIASPYYILKDAGISVSFATPKGGEAPIDPVSELPDFQTDATHRYKDDPELQRLIASTLKLSQVTESEFDAVFCPGGQGPLYDLVTNEDSIRLIESFWAKDKVVAALCHGLGSILNVKDSHGEFIVKGRQVTGFSNAEETEYGTNELVPYLVEDEMKARDGKYSKSDNWTQHVVADGLLITGQNPASSEAVAKLLFEKIS
jgi:putative intracellular protease/amidase